jgi:hypothetical protein
MKRSLGMDRRHGASRLHQVPRALLFLVAVLVVPQLLLAQQPRREDGTVIEIDSVLVQGRLDDLAGIASSASQGRVGAVDLRSRPIAREGELLETVPGMIVTQHSGEGKANQYFVRGFNLDHGTDFQTRVEGMPVNLPTHGHGQGYTDLNFIIPEFVQLLDYRLGVHHAEIGDFGSAGGAEFHLARTLDRPFASLALGEHGFTRLVAGASRETGVGDLLLGGEAKLYDGPWERPNDLRKFNGLARYSTDRGASRFSVLAMAYRNEWNASDQIPSRAVESGQIGRFGQIDPTDGGESRRYSLSGSWTQVAGQAAREVELFGMYSDLDLYSNFTYALDDPADGDQFNQKDRRVVLGGNAKHAQNVRAWGAPHVLTAGAQSRADFIDDVGLHRTVERVRRGTIRQDRVVGTATGVFLEAVSRWSSRFRSNLAIRGDWYTFDVESDRAENSGAGSAGIVSPKASLVFSPSAAAEIYLSGGFGFHSNDARGTAISVDPVTGEPARRVDPLVRSQGGEVGLRTAPLEGLRTTLTLWVLELDSELLFVGDAGATEPTSTSRRQGVTWANFYRPIPSFTIDADLSIARARLTDVPGGESRIPGALENVFAGGVAWSPPSGPFGAIRIRRFGDYPLIEDNSVRADAAMLLSARIGYLLPRGLRIEASLLNLLDSEAADVQYFYESRLPGEPTDGVADVHFHPLEPRQLRVSLRWEF